jgi:hypothetical protein
MHTSFFVVPFNSLFLEGGGDAAADYREESQHGTGTPSAHNMSAARVREPLALMQQDVLVQASAKEER